MLSILKEVDDELDIRGGGSSNSGGGFGGNINEVEDGATMEIVESGGGEGVEGQEETIVRWLDLKGEEICDLYTHLPKPSTSYSSSFSTYGIAMPMIYGYIYINNLYLCFFNLIRPLTTRYYSLLQLYHHY